MSFNVKRAVDLALKRINQQGKPEMVEQPKKEETIVIKSLPIQEAIEMTGDIPEIQTALQEMFEDDADFVTITITDESIAIDPITEDAYAEIVAKEGGAPAATGPTAEASHVDSPEWNGGKKRKKRNVQVMDETAAIVFSKAMDEELRYTLSPWYVPDSLDAHGEWTDKKEVQQAFWKYLALDDRDIRLQHNVDIVAGKWVEGMTWPYEVTVPVRHPEGDREITFPSGTPFLGIIWEPWAWDLIKAGEIRGLSIGGTAKRVEAEVEASDYDPTGKVAYQND